MGLGIRFCGGLGHWVVGNYVVEAQVLGVSIFEFQVCLVIPYKKVRYKAGIFRIFRNLMLGLAKA